MTTPSSRAHTRLYIADAERTDDMLAAPPRQRVSMNRATPLALTGDWQVVPFVQGASNRDGFTFPASRFDFANRLILANPATGYEQAYSLSLDLGVQINDASSYCKLAVRFVVPRPTAQGGPIYFPLPDTLGRIDLPDALLPPTGAVHFDYPVYTSALVRQFGAQVQVRGTSYRMNSGLIGGLVGTVASVLTGSARPTLTDAVMNMYGL